MLWFFLKIYLAVIVDLPLRAVTDSFEIYNINSSIKKKIESNCIRFEALFGIAQPKESKEK